jgi:hypothetical protein
MPNAGSRSKRSARKGKNNGSSSQANGGAFRDALSQGMAGSSSFGHFVSTDLRLRPIPATFKVSMPRSIQNQIVWSRNVFTQSVPTSATLITENNFAPTATAALTQAATWLSLFDQYYLHSFFATVSNTESPASAAQCPTVYTAIDFDSSGNLGSVGAISSYTTCNSSTLTPGASITRLIQPCNSTTMSGVAGAGVNRTWVDSSTNNVLFYAYRCIVGATPGAVINLQFTYTLNWCFRNSF